MLRRELVDELLQRWHVTAAKCRDVSTPQRLNRAETRVEPVTRLGLRLRLGSGERPSRRSSERPRLCRDERSSRVV